VQHRAVGIGCCAATDDATHSAVYGPMVMQDCAP